jgi:hypothetical protein
MMNLKNPLKSIPLLLALCLGLPLGAQVRISSEEELKILGDTPMEAMYMHTSGTLFMPGEYLYFSLYCINTQTYKLSDLSEVAYVQLIGEDNGVVFTQKIDLVKGRGQGDYFFPTSLPSGNYKLVSYTHWMKNAGTAQFFAGDLTFLNPYRADQAVFLDPGRDGEGCSARREQGVTEEPAEPSRDLGILLEKASFKKGEQVRLQVKNFRGARGYGTYSLSVRRRDGLPGPDPVSAVKYAESYPQLLKKIPQRVNDILSIPEQRGELISGQVTTPAGIPLEGASISLSLPGTDFQVKKVRTDGEGKFYTYLTRPYRGRTGMAEVVSPGVEKALFNWFSPHDFEGDIPCFYHFELKPDMAAEIRKRSIDNQVENSYFEAKPDTLEVPVASDPFEGEVPEVYNLEDYTRFATLEETLVELIEHVWVKQEDDGGATFWVRQPMAPRGPDYTTDPPLVVVDGILVPDHNGLLGYDARKIKTIRVLREKYQLGGESYQGMVVIETIDNTFSETWDVPLGTSFTFLPPSPRKNYFRQMAAPGNIPDYRSQLLWEPDITLQGGTQTYSFIASRLSGTYEVRLEGFTTYGKPITLKTYFQIEED